MPLNGRALTAIGVGSLFVWSGIKGWSILGTAGDLLLGTKPSQPVLNTLGSYSLGSGGMISDLPGGSNSIVSIALGYKGHAYRFGGAPGKDGSKPWDCSSFVNYVCGVKAGIAIPGYGPGKYDGSSHGPVTGTWAVWPGLTRVSKTEVQAGDILVWVGHMGIAVSNTQMISALNPSQGTLITPIEGQSPGPILIYGRLK